MRRYIVASHGKMASGLVEGLNIIAGSFLNLSTINAYVDGHEYGDSFKKAKELIDKYPDDEFVIMTDLLGGSVNTELMPLQSEKVHIVAGTNLAILLTMVTSSEDENTKDLVNRAIEEAKEGIVYCNTVCAKDEDFQEKVNGKGKN